MSIFRYKLNLDLLEYIIILVRSFNRKIDKRKSDVFLRVKISHNLMKLSEAEFIKF